jgi:hypothetical protein
MDTWSFEWMNKLQVAYNMEFDLGDIVIKCNMNER